MERVAQRSSHAGSGAMAGSEGYSAESPELPARRRLRRKISLGSVTEVSDDGPVIRLATAPERLGEMRRSATQEEDCMEIVCDAVAEPAGGGVPGAALESSRGLGAAAAVSGSPGAMEGCDMRRRRELEAGAAEQRGAAEERRGLGDVAVARRMAARSQRRDALEEQERGGRGGGSCRGRGRGR